MKDEPEAKPSSQAEEGPPFGSWLTIYLVVLLWAVAVMGAIGLFSSWRY